MMLTYANSKKYLLLSVAGVMVQGCVAYVDPYPETTVYTRSQSVVEVRPPFFGFDVFYDYYDRPYYVDSYRRVIYVDTKYYPYVKSHYQYRKTDYGRYVKDHDDNRGRGNPNDISKPNHVDNTIVNHSKDTEDKKNVTSSNKSGRSKHNTDDSNNNHSNDSGRTY